MKGRPKNPCGMTVDELRDHVWRLGSEYQLADAIGRSVNTVRAWLRHKTNVHPRMAAVIRALPDGRPQALSRRDFETAVLLYGGVSAVAHRYGLSFWKVAGWTKGEGVPPDWLLKELQGCFTVVEQ